MLHNSLKCNTLKEWLRGDLRSHRVGEYNLDHATKRLTAAEIEQAIWNATTASRHRSEADRRLIRSATDGGKRVILIVQLIDNGVRPITGWEAE